MNKLRCIELEKKDDASLVCLQIHLEHDEVVPVFKGLADFGELLDWFLMYEKDIMDGNFPLEMSDGKSIAENISYIYDGLKEDNEDDEEITDKLFGYRLSHCLRFGARGVDFPAIYLGRVKGGHEISFFEGGGGVGL